MKQLTLVVHADIQDTLADQLRAHRAVNGFTFTTAEGHGAHEGQDALLSLRDQVVGYVPHVRVDILLDDAVIEEVLHALQQPQSGVAGRGIFWVTDVSRHGRL